MNGAGTAFVAATIAALLFGGEPIRNRLASHLLELSVENHDGQKLGRVREVIFDLHSGTVPYLVIASGGVLGINQRLKIIPAPALSTATVKKGTAALGISKVRWANAPDFNRNELVAYTRPDFLRSIYQFYGLATNSLPRLLELNSNTEVFGRIAVDPSGKQVGLLADALIDLSGRQPVLAVITRDGLFKHHGNFAVPLRSIELTRRGRVSTPFRYDQFELAPALDEAKWRAMSTNATMSVYRFKAPDSSATTKKPKSSAP